VISNNFLTMCCGNEVFTHDAQFLKLHGDALWVKAALQQLTDGQLGWHSLKMVPTSAEVRQSAMVYEWWCVKCWFNYGKINITPWRLVHSAHRAAVTDFTAPAREGNYK
jgi:hypothetical protein